MRRRGTPLIDDVDCQIEAVDLIKNRQLKRSVDVLPFSLYPRTCMLS